MRERERVSQRDKRVRVLVEMKESKTERDQQKVRQERDNCSWGTCPFRSEHRGIRIQTAAEFLYPHLLFSLLFPLSSLLFANMSRLTQIPRTVQARGLYLHGHPKQILYPYSHTRTHPFPRSPDLQEQIFPSICTAYKHKCYDT